MNYRFSSADAYFIERYGIKKATEKIYNFCEKYKNIPPIFDTHQLADFLLITHKSMFSVIRNTQKHYVSVSVPKKNGKTRQLTVPDKKLKSAQKIILKEILNHIPVSKYATAYKRGATLFDNAKPHTGKKFLLKIDLKDFFGSISFESVYNCVFYKFYNKQISTLLTTLCCYNEYLPQGAPTSPAISNIVMRHFDDLFGGWCERNGFSYTRYCDDITVSGNSSLYIAYQKAKGILENMGFELNEDKTHFVSNGARQSVTGLTVNQKVSVSREYKRKLRQDIYYYFEFGKIPVNGYCELLGKVNFVLQTEPDNEEFSDAFEKLKDKY